MAVRAKLIPVDGGPPVDLPRDLTIVGRREDCDLRLDHKSVSKQHCVLAFTDGLVIVRDLGSTNGTRVNGTRVRRAALVPGDVVGFASIRYKVAVGKEEEPSLDPNARTQHLESADFERMLKHVPPEPAPPKLDPKSGIDVKLGILPDVYPEA